LFASNTFGSFTAEVSPGVVVGVLVSGEKLVGVAGAVEQPLVVSRKIRAVRADP
jgi:hypothetical protein